MSNSVMRVWALASCGGLLALAACSSEQSSTSKVDSTSPLEDDLARIDAQPEPVAPLPRPLVRPEAINSRPLFPSATTIAGRQSVSSSAEQLRARVQQIRAQRAKALPTSGAPTFSNGGSKPVTTVSPVSVGGENPVPSANSTALSRSVLPTSQQIVTALPTPGQPTPASGGISNSPISPVSPSVADELATAPIHSSAPATSQAPTALTRNTPTTPSRHQSFSTSSGQVLALTPPSSPRAAGGSSVELTNDPSTAPRTHHIIASTTESEQSATSTSSQPLFPLAETPEREADLPAAATTETDAMEIEQATVAEAAPDTSANPDAAATSLTPESGGHLSAGSPTLTTAPQPAGSPLNLQPGSPSFSNRTPTQHISGVATLPSQPQPEASVPTASPLAESLPLHGSPSVQRSPRIQIGSENTLPRLTSEPQLAGSRATSPETTLLTPGFSTIELNPAPRSTPEPVRESPNESATSEAGRPEIRPMNSHGSSPKALTLSYCSRPDLLTSLLANPAARSTEGEANPLKTKIKTLLSNSGEQPESTAEAGPSCSPGAKPQLHGQIHGLK